VLRRRALTIGAALCAAALVLPAAAGQARPTAVGPGAPGAGDEYFPGYGNGGYDVSHYDLRLKYTPATDTLQGAATLTARPTEDLTAFNLDFALNASSIRVNGLKAGYVRRGTELTVTPARPLTKGQLTTVVVEYAGVPSQVIVDGFTAWSRTSDGALAIGEPEIAAWWFPSNDHPSDKATFDISVAVPDGTEVISIGTLTGKTSQLGWTRWNWRSAKPTATYLASLVIGQYEINTDTAANGQPIITAYSEKLGANGDAAKASVERTGEIIEFLSSKLGPYPFEAQGGVVPAEGLGYALENQTRPSYSPAFFRRGQNTYVVVHENGHQWFGDSVSVAKWRNIWLNEGFASYTEWLWSEEKGEGTAQELFDHTYASIPASDPFWQVLPGDPGADKVFNGAVYDRGALTVHALRNAVGDDAFFQILRTWVSGKQYSNGTIEQFIALAKQISGKPLDELFTKWLFTKGKPAVSAATGVQASAARAQVAAPKSAIKIKQAHESLHAGR
jgi:aminopeptidase N